MMQSATAYRQVGARSTLLGAVDSLENIVSSPLPDGSECWVIENASVYRFDKSSTETADGTRVVAPIAGGGRWFRLPIAPLLMTSSSLSFGSVSGNVSGGIRIAGAILRNIPIGSSVLMYGTFSGQPPSVDGGAALLTYQTSQNTAIQTVTRSQFFEATATRRAFTASGFLGPFNVALSWIYVRLSFQSLVATSMTFLFPPDQASLTVMALPPLTKV
jgi:hypothetical protein